MVADNRNKLPYPKAISIDQLLGDSIPEPTLIALWGRDLPKDILAAMRKGETVLMIDENQEPYCRLFVDVFGTMRQGPIDNSWKIFQKIKGAK